MQLNPECVCINCRHMKQDEIKGTFTCKAFPNGIPQDILTGVSKHDNIREDQKNDVVFEEFSFTTKTDFQ